MPISQAKFKNIIWTHYRNQGRHDLPWRPPSLKLRADKSLDPYKILVSEVMLQQTQVSRVLIKYKEFLKKFPTMRKLAASPQSEVLKVWQGLGYNRRALALHRLAKEHRTLPKTFDELVALPGIGPYTAAAVMAFAHNTALPMIETNIRRVYIHYFDVTHDKDILHVVAQTLDHKKPREWLYALMDYGAMLPKSIPNPNRRSNHYTRQSKFEGSHRQLRGTVLRLVLKKQKIPKTSIMQKVLKELQQEGFVR